MMEDLLKEEASKIEQVEIDIPPGPRLGDMVEGARRGARLWRTCC